MITSTEQRAIGAQDEDLDREWPSGVSTSDGTRFRTLREALAHEDAWKAKIAAGKIRPPSFVYFIGGAKRVKIGYAKHPRRRLSAIQVGSPDRLALLAVMPGAQAEEAALHTEFAHLRLSGEWFRIDRALRNRIKALYEEHGYWYYRA